MILSAEKRGKIFEVIQEATSDLHHSILLSVLLSVLLPIGPGQNGI